MSKKKKDEIKFNVKKPRVGNFYKFKFAGAVYIGVLTHKIEELSDKGVDFYNIESVERGKTWIYPVKHADIIQLIKNKI